MKTKLDNHQGIAVFTDGSAYTKDRSGGWGFVIIDVFGNEVEGQGSKSDTTISQMELAAVANALWYIHKECGPSEVLVFSDSEYVVLGMNDKSRARNKNNEYWDDLEAQTAKHEAVEFEHVKGHNQNKYNERADELAGKARKERK